MGPVAIVGRSVCLEKNDELTFRGSAKNSLYAEELQHREIWDEELMECIKVQDYTVAGQDHGLSERLIRSGGTPMVGSGQNIVVLCNESVLCITVRYSTGLENTDGASQRVSVTCPCKRS
jgi:hypothetical protein